MKQLTYKTWVPFAWHGVSMTVPSEWNPGKITGDEKSGSVRLDDSQMVRLELEWKEARGDKRVTQIIDRYVDGLAQNAKKEKRSLQVNRNVQLSGLENLQLESPEYFVWESGNTIHTLAGYSSETDRLLFIRVMTRPEEDPLQSLEILFGAISDTSAESARSWAIYDLICQAPANYNLESYELKSGHIKLLFASANNTVRFDRLSLAEVLLQNSTLGDWFREFFSKEIRHIEVNIDDQDTQAHEGIEITGKPKSRWRGLLQPLPFWNVRPRRDVSGRAWVCPESNKIYCVQASWKKAEEAPDIQNCCDSVTCHVKED